jgi:hypothetical protein
MVADDEDVIDKERLMKKMIQAAVMAAAVLAIPALSFAAQAKPAATPVAAKPAVKTTAKPALHSTRGVVKSIDPASLVISAKTGKKSHDMSFVLDNSTQKTGNPAVGSTVQVKYHNAAKQHVATEVRATGAKKS